MTEELPALLGRYEGEMIRQEPRIPGEEKVLRGDSGSGLATSRYVNSHDR